MTEPAMVAQLSLVSEQRRNVQTRSKRGWRLTELSVETSGGHFPKREFINPYCTEMLTLAHVALTTANPAPAVEFEQVRAESRPVR